jgi:hypothetical protein
MRRIDATHRGIRNALEVQNPATSRQECLLHSPQPLKHSILTRFMEILYLVDR